MIAHFRTDSREGVVKPTLVAGLAADDSPIDVPVSEGWTVQTRLITATTEKVLVGVGARIETDRYDCFIFVDDFSLVEVPPPLKPR